MSEADRSVVAFRLAAELARARHEGQAAAALAQAAAVLVGAESVRVWMMDRTRGYRVSGAWPAEAAPPDAPPPEVARAVVLGAVSVTRPGAPMRSRLAVPLMSGLRPMGALELLESRRETGPFTDADTAALGGLVEAADSALEAVRATAAREKGNIEAIARLTRLFDIGRSFAATLDLEPLARIVANRVQASLEAGGAYLWLHDAGAGTLRIAAASGPASDLVGSWEVRAEEGVAGKVAASGEALLFEDPEEIPDLTSRPDATAGIAITSLAAVPVTTDDDQLLGVIEVVNKEDGSSFDEDDLTFLREAAGSTAIAIGNARRIDAERRASGLSALLEIAQELGSSLDVQKVAFTLVHRAASVISYRQAVVGLFKGAALELAAVSGQTFVDEAVPEMKALRDLLTWAAGLEEGIYVVQEDDGSIDADRPETREKFRSYFETTGGRSFLAIPLGDDEGTLGVFALEAAEPYAFSAHALEAARLLAVQATVSIRNATLYQQIPMARVFHPLGRRREQLRRLSSSRRIAWAAGAAVLLAAAIFVPVPLRVGGDARVISDRPDVVSAEVDGIVSRVLVREGDAVRPGQVLATLDAAEYAAGLERARAALGIARREADRLRADGRAAEAAGSEEEMAGLRADLALWEGRLERTWIRAASEGLVATPRVDEKVGVRLARGEVFCEIVDPVRQRVEVAVSEKDTGLLAEGMPVKIKFSSYPETAFRATIERIGVAATQARSEPAFLVRARLTDAPWPLREGMTGRAKIRTGSASILRVVFRRPARWIWGRIWGWLP